MALVLENTPVVPVSVPPCNDNAPAMALREPMSNVPAVLVIVPAAVANVVTNCKVPAPVWLRLLKLLPPAVSVCVPLVAVKLTVPVPGVKVPPALDQLPETLNAPEEFGAVKVPLAKVTLVVLTVPPAPVRVPPLIVRPPLKLC